MLESESPKIVFDAAHPHPFETYTKPQQEVPAPSSQQFCVFDSCERSKFMHGIPGSSYSREKDGETESRRDGNRRSNRSQLLLRKENKHTQTHSQRPALQQNPNQQKAQQRRRRRCSSSVGVARNNNNYTHTSHNCKHPFAVAERNNSNTQPIPSSSPIFKP
jgi:hypothetical protein